MKVLCAIKNHFERKNETLLVIAYFFFELPPSTFSKVSFYVILPAEAFQFLLFQVSRCYFHMKLYEIRADLSWGWGEGEGWFRSQSLIALCILGI